MQHNTRTLPELPRSIEYQYLRVPDISASSTLRNIEDNFSFQYPRDSRGLLHFSQWYPGDSRDLKHSAFSSTLGTREGSVISASSTSGAHEVSVISAFSTSGIQDFNKKKLGLVSQGLTQGLSPTDWYWYSASLYQFFFIG